MSVFTYVLFFGLFFFFKQKTAYEMRISDWSSDVCSSDLDLVEEQRPAMRLFQQAGADKLAAFLLAEKLLFHPFRLHPGGRNDDERTIGARAPEVADEIGRAHV